MTSARALGFWSAILAVIFSVAYDLAQVGEWLGWLGSGGGAENSSTPLGLAVLLTPSLLLGPSFLLAMIGLDRSTPDERRVWTSAGCAFAAIYAALTGIVYFVQLTLVAPRLAAGDIKGIEFLLFVPFRSFLYPVDLLGYSFMSLATLFAAGGMGPGPSDRPTRWWLIANGLLVPFIALQMFFHSLIWIAALWAVTFPVSMALLAMRFRRG